MGGYHHLAAGASSHLTKSPATFLPEALILTAHSPAVSISSVRKKCIERKYPGPSPVPHLFDFGSLSSVL